MKTNDTPAMNAMFMISVCQIANIFTIFIIINHFAKITLETRSDIIVLATILILTLFLSDYFLLYKNLNKLCIRYENEVENKKLIGTIFLLTYILGSFFIVYLVSTNF